MSKKSNERKNKKQNKEHRGNLKKDNSTRNLTLGMVIFVIVVGVLFSFISNSSNAHALNPKDAVKKYDQGITFNNTAINKPLLEIYEDPQCPVCKHFEDTTGSVVRNLLSTKKAKVVYHILSFLGPDSQNMANSLACADNEDKFLALHDYYYQHQVSENSGFWTLEHILSAGSAVGLTDKKFVTCVSNNQYSPYVTNVENAAGNHNVNGTPTIFLNGKPIPNTVQNYNDPKNFLALVNKG